MKTENRRFIETSNFSMTGNFYHKTSFSFTVASMQLLKGTCHSKNYQSCVYRRENKTSHIKNLSYIENLLVCIKGRTIRKVMGGGGGGGKKKKKKRGGEKKKKKKIRAPEMFEKKNSCRDFSIGKIISWCVYYIYIILRCSVI
jgi:hypothetical protein